MKRVKRTGHLKERSPWRGLLAKFYGDYGVKALTVPVYQMVLKVDPALLGLVLAVPRLWDALMIHRRMVSTTVDLVSAVASHPCSRAILQASHLARFGWSRRVKSVRHDWILVVTLLIFYTCFSISRCR